MTKGFREAVERYMCGNPDPERIDSHLKDMFDVLEKKTACTYNIIKRLGIDRVYEQQDAAEYFEKILALTSDEASQIFHGELTHKTICSKCLTEKNADGLFWHLPLELVDSYSEHYSVMAGTEEYFRDLNFSGENQMYCDQCDDKSDATIKCVIKHHPEVLMLLLKRFEFNCHYMIYFKNNRVVDVPRTLQIPENQTYELYAVVDHFGDLRSGHYTARVKSEDDERWYNFNDARVSLLDYQPFQVDNSESSCSAYLLFYRKKTTHAADTCTQDMKEVSTNGGFPPAAGDNDEPCQDEKKEKAKKRKREEVEETAEVGNDTAEAASIDRNGETGIRDTVSVGSVVDVRQSLPHNHQECREERSDLRDQDAEKRERGEGKIMRDDEEEEDDTGAGEQAEKRGPSSTETRPEESREGQDSYRGEQDNVRLNRPQECLEGKVVHNTSYNEQKCKQEVSDMHVGYDYPQQVCVNMRRDEERKVMNVNKDENRKTAGDEQSDKKGKSLTKYPNRDAKDEASEGSDIVKHVNDDEGAKQEVREENNLQPVRVDKNRDAKEMEKDIKDEEGGKTGADKLISGRGKLLSKSDFNFHEFHRSGDRKQNVSGEDGRTHKQGGSSRSYKRHEPSKEEGRDVKGDKEQKRGDDEPARKIRASERRQHFGQDVEDQSRRVDVRPNRPEQNISVTHKRHESVGSEKQVREEKHAGDTQHIQIRHDSSLRQAGSAGKGSLTERRRGGSVEKTGNSQSTARAEFKDVTVEGVQESERSSGMETVEKISQDSIKRRVNNRGSIKGKDDPKPDEVVTLTEGVRSINLNDSPLPKPQKHKAKKVSGKAKGKNETEIVPYSHAREESDAQTQDGEKSVMKKGHKMMGGLWCLPKKQKERKEKPKKNKTIGCFPMLKRKRKKAESKSE
uniref:Ubiquitin carboxyl-terminal hydrolase 20-like n=1 Tax=Seriola dumerili TaxID=41447 RepID=A0A3B4TQD6_SERDU